MVFGKSKQFFSPDFYIEMRQGSGVFSSLTYEPGCEKWEATFGGNITISQCFQSAQLFLKVILYSDKSVYVRKTEWDLVMSATRPSSPARNRH